jgi:hypothetical protein
MYQKLRFVIHTRERLAILVVTVDAGSSIAGLIAAALLNHLNHPDGAGFGPCQSKREAVSGVGHL